MENSIEELFQSELSDKMKDIFLKIQKARNEHDLNTLTLLESPYLFEQDARKIKLLNLNGKKQVKKDIVIHYISLREYYIKDGYEYIEVEIKATLEDYIYQLTTNEVVEGIRDYNLTKKYQVVFKKTKKEEEVSEIVKCIACNANVETKALGKCEYCGTIAYNKEYNWIIDRIEESR